MACGPAFAEDDNVELALDPPDDATDQLLEEAVREDSPGREPDDIAQERREPRNEADVPLIGDENFQARNTEQQRLLNYHRQIILEREALAASGKEDPPHRFHVGAGFLFSNQGAGNGQLLFDFQTTLADHFTFGVGGYLGKFTAAAGTNVGGVIVDSGNISNVALNAGFNYYSRRPYEGIFITLASGFEFFRAGDNYFTAPIISSTPPIVFAMGWRWLGSDNLTFSFQGGGTTYFFVNNPTFNFTLRLALGLAFNVFPH